jgi:electron transfer flavoprotein alpha subunit
MNAEIGLIAVVPVRDGVLPAGGLEALAESRGVGVLVGTDLDAAVDAAHGVASRLILVPTTSCAPRVLADAAATALDAHAPQVAVVVPASPDGRDLAPLLARRLDRPLHAGATEVSEHRVRTARQGGLAIAQFDVHRPFVATLQPGVRGVEQGFTAPPEIVRLDPSSATTSAVTTLEVLPPDVSTMDLAEAPRIVGGGAGLDSAERFARLAEVSKALDASMGVTRVITDRGWVSHERQIGTTGVVVDPRLYLSFGISGAVQHTSGLGQPDHIISVNTDAHCPMMQMSDLAIVADANEVLDALSAKLSADTRKGVA